MKKKLFLLLVIVFLMGVIVKPVLAGGHRPPIFTAITNNDMAKLRQIFDHSTTFLEERGYPVDSTPLLYACSMGRTKMVKYLISRGANIYARVNYYKGERGFTCLHYAARNGYKDILLILLKKGLKHDLKDSYGKTPLYYATKYRHRDVTRILQGYKYRDLENKKNK